MQNRIVVGVALLLTLSTAVARTFFHTNADGLEGQGDGFVSKAKSASNPELTQELLAALEADARIDDRTWLKRPL
jgi:hypothetical protein